MIFKLNYVRRIYNVVIFLQQTNVIVFAVEIQPVPQNYNREIGMTNMIICNTRVYVLI